MRPHPLALLLFVLLAACGGRVPLFGGDPVLAPERLSLLEGDTARFTLVGADGDEVEWASADTTVVRIVGPGGRIVGVGEGRTLVTARTADGALLRGYVYVSRAVLVGAGDIGVCGYEEDEATARLLDGIAGIIWTAGDNAYPSGTRQNFRECYDPTWGRHKDRTRPTPGNHEYRSPGAAPYFEYFGDAAGEAGKGWYSYRYGGWLIIALNSNLSALSPAVVAEQMAWLRETLDDEPVRCTLAYFHHPLFSSGSHGGNADEDVRPFYQALYDAGADVVLVGHDHHYERFPPLDPQGRLDPDRGLRQFLVGTGGGALREEGANIHPLTEVYNDTDHGVLELALHSDWYEWQFVTIGGSGADAGRGTCH